MQPSIFNTQVPLPDRNDVFIMNTFTDAQLIVSSDVAGLLDRLKASSEVLDSFNVEERTTLNELAEHGFVVKDGKTERDALEKFFNDVREDTTELRVTVLTTLQCNFACDYCLQGDHGDYNMTAEKMSMEDAVRVCDWVEGRFEENRPEKFSLMFFGGEPLLNLPVLYYVAERLWGASRRRGIEMVSNVITNGLLLRPEVVDRLLPYGLNGFKVTLDGDQETHDRMRPLRGGQGTFDKIIANIRSVADRCSIAIGGNFDEESVASYPALLEFLREQDFASSLVKVAFKPIIRTGPQPAATAAGLIPLTAVDSGGKPLGGACMTGTGGGTGSPCDTCQFLDDKTDFLREETKKAGFETIDGVHMGPCEIHRRHSYTIGVNGSLFACPGFAAEPTQATGHIDGRQNGRRHEMAATYDAVSAWRDCDDCSFIPVCAGGCTVASHNELGDINTPSCHKTSFESALVSLARDAAGIPQPVIPQSQSQ